MQFLRAAVIAGMMLPMQALGADTTCPTRADLKGGIVLDTTTTEDKRSSVIRRTYQRINGNVIQMQMTLFKPSGEPETEPQFPALHLHKGLILSGRTGKIYSEPSQLPYSAIRDGAARAPKFGSNWSRASLSDVNQNFAGANYRMHRTATGKEIFENPTTGVQVIYDIDGQYFRIHDPNLPSRRTYLDWDGTVPNNKINPDRTQSGRSQVAYNVATHFLAN